MRCKDIAMEAHEGQFRRDGVTPYYVHLELVAGNFSDGHFNNVAWLHDILEDTDETPASLIEKGVSEDVVASVVAMTKVDGEVYLVYLKRVLENPIALQVKIFDMVSNLSDDPTPEQVQKYSAGLRVLLHALVRSTNEV